MNITDVIREVEDSIQSRLSEDELDNLFEYVEETSDNKNRKAINLLLARRYQEEYTCSRGSQQWYFM